VVAARQQTVVLSGQDIAAGIISDLARALVDLGPPAVGLWNPRSAVPGDQIRGHAGVPGRPAGGAGGTLHYRRRRGGPAAHATGVTLRGDN